MWPSAFKWKPVGQHHVTAVKPKKRRSSSKPTQMQDSPVSVRTPVGSHASSSLQRCSNLSNFMTTSNLISASKLVGRHLGWIRAQWPQWVTGSGKCPHRKIVVFDICHGSNGLFCWDSSLSFFYGSIPSIWCVAWLIGVIGPLSIIPGTPKISLDLAWVPTQKNCSFRHLPWIQWTLFDETHHYHPFMDPYCPFDV